MYTNYYIIAILCNNKIQASERVTDERVQRAEAAKEKYKQQRNHLEILKAELSTKRAYINDKKEELERFSRDKVKQQEPIDNLSKLTTKLEESGDVITSISKEITEAEEGQAELIKEIGEAERQLKNTKDSMEECLISLQRQIRDLESEENVVLQERGLGKTRRTPYQPKRYTRAGAVAGTLFGVGAGALIGAGAAGAGEVVGGLLAGSLFLGKSVYLYAPTVFLLTSALPTIRYPLSKYGKLPRSSYIRIIYRGWGGGALRPPLYMYM
jgi:hypothetical protein